MNNDFGYVALDLTPKSRKMLSDAVSLKFSKKNFFVSQDPGYTYINGNVCKKAHVTVCYGINNSDLQSRFKASKQNIRWQKTTKIKNVEVNLGYMDKYYIIVAIPEISNGIHLFDSWIRENNELIPDASALDPHISLCYIKNTFNKYPTGILEFFQKKMVGKTVQFDSVNFYTPKNRQRKTLARISH